MIDNNSDDQTTILVLQILLGLLSVICVTEGVLLFQRISKDDVKEIKVDEQDENAELKPRSVSFAKAKSVNNIKAKKHTGPRVKFGNSRLIQTEEWKRQRSQRFADIRARNSKVGGGLQKQHSILHGLKNIVV